MNSLFEDLAPIEKPKHRNVFATLGASNHALDKRADADLYCTHPDAVINLLNLEKFSAEIWEPCCGLGHISDTLEQYGNYNVRKSDIISRRSDIETLDFLSLSNVETWNGDIITNPPYSCANEMVEKAISLVGEGFKVAMWLRILFLESSSRKSLFDAAPPNAFMCPLSVFRVLRMEISSRMVTTLKDMLGLFGRKDIVEIHS